MSLYRLKLRIHTMRPPTCIYIFIIYPKIPTYTYSTYVYLCKNNTPHTLF